MGPGLDPAGTLGPGPKPRAGTQDRPLGPGPMGTGLGPYGSKGFGGMGKGFGG